MTESELSQLTNLELRNLSRSVKRILAFRNGEASTPIREPKSFLRYHKKELERFDLSSIPPSVLLSLPISNKEQFDAKRIYLASLLRQDWSAEYAAYEDESTDFYVYVHLDPRKKNFACQELNIYPAQGEPFYVGKGCGDRAFDLKRNQGHGKIIKVILDRGYAKGSIPRVIFENLSERKALIIESKLIYFFGSMYEVNRRGSLVNLDIPKRPKFSGQYVDYVKTERRKLHWQERRAEKAIESVDAAERVEF